MATLYLIRHGQASFGSDNYDQLSELGQLQADLTGQFFRDIGVNFDMAFAGDLSRQRETGERVLASQLHPCLLHIDPRFNEINNEEQVKALLPRLCAENEQLRAVVAEGLNNSKRYQKVIEAVFNAWVAPQCDVVGIQSWPDFRDQVYEAIDHVMAIAGSGATSAIFSSGGTIAALVARVLGASADGIYQFYEPMMNCSITQLFYSRSRVSLSCFNDVAHLQLLGAQRQTALVTYR